MLLTQVCLKFKVIFQGALELCRENHVECICEMALLGSQRHFILEKSTHSIGFT